MAFARGTLVLTLLVLALAPAAVGAAQRAQAATAAPSDLHGFLLRSDDSRGRTHTFPRTPAFAWEPVAGAEAYEFQLSTSRSFAESAIVWEDRAAAPVMTVPVTLPWVGGAGYSWYARVRPMVSGVEGPWSALYGFNLRPPGAPRSLSTGPNPQPGMVRWTPVEGATAYEVVFLLDQARGETKKIRTATTAADLREYYTFHNTRATANVVYWRARAVREVYGETKNKLPAVSYGPWSGRNRTVEPDLAAAMTTLEGAISRSGSSDVLSSSQSGGPGPGPHELVPGFWWSGTLGPAVAPFSGSCPLEVAALGVLCPLFHVYVYTDPDCVNRVHISDLVGSPAYVPRLSPALALPGDVDQLKKAASLWLGDGSEGTVFDVGGEKILATGVTAEEEAASGTAADSGAADSGAAAGEPTGAEPPSEEPAAKPEAPAADRKNGLWDSDSPTSRYYWTVVPAVPTIEPDLTVEYHDVAFPQDMCAEGRVISFGKTSATVTAAASGVPFLSGMSPSGRLLAASSARPSFYGELLATWKPTPGAQQYEIQWSQQLLRWRTAGKVVTPATSALLDLAPGRWYYRVRGLDTTLPGPSGLAWSDAVEVSVASPRFDVVGRQGRKR